MIRPISRILSYFNLLSVHCQWPRHYLMGQTAVYQTCHFLKPFVIFLLQKNDWVDDLMLSDNLNAWRNIWHLGRSTCYSLRVSWLLANFIFISSKATTTTILYNRPFNCCRPSPVIITTRLRQTPPSFLKVEQTKRRNHCPHTHTRNVKMLMCIGGQFFYVNPPVISVSS